MKTKREELQSKIEEIVSQVYLGGDEGEPEESVVPTYRDELLSLFIEFVEELKPQADLEEARKHRPDDSVGFMLGWNAYEAKLNKKLAELGGK